MRHKTHKMSAQDLCHDSTHSHLHREKPWSRNWCLAYICGPIAFQILHFQVMRFPVPHFFVPHFIILHFQPSFVMLVVLYCPVPHFREHFQYTRTKFDQFTALTTFWPHLPNFDKIYGLVCFVRLRHAHDNTVASSFTNPSATWMSIIKSCRHYQKRKRCMKSERSGISIARVCTVVSVLLCRDSRHFYSAVSASEDFFSILRYINVHITLHYITLGARAPPGRRENFFGRAKFTGESCKCTPRQRVHPRVRARVQFFEEIGETWAVGEVI